MADGYIPSAELTFGQYKQSLKTFLSNQDTFKDYDFEGSNMSVLLDLLAYNTFSNAHYVNMSGTDAFLDTAQMRESIVSRAKELNYIPRSRSSASMLVDVEIVPAGAPSQVVIPKNYGFKTALGGGSYTRFLTDQAYTSLRDQQGRYIFTDVAVYEGVSVKERFVISSTKQPEGYWTYDSTQAMRSDNIDTSSIEVAVFLNGGNVATYFERAESLFGLTDTSNIFFLEGFGSNQYAIVFGDGRLGKALPTGTIVEVTYRDTLGAEGNGSFSLSKTTPIDGHSNVDVYAKTAATGGGERESNASIKYNAPRHFQVQQRGVVISDFRVMIESNYPQIQQAHVYGGEVEKLYGRVLISLKPYGSYGIVPAYLKDQISSFLETKTLTTQIEFRDPNYSFVVVEGVVDYNSTKATTTYSGIKSAIQQSITTFAADQMVGFDNDTYLSKVAAAIELSDNSIVGSDLSFRLMKLWSPSSGIAVGTTFSFGNLLESEVSGGTCVSSSLFTAYDSTLTTTMENCILMDDGAGGIDLFQLIQDQYVVVSKAVGTVDYTVGTVVLNVPVYGYAKDGIRLYVRPLKSMVTAEQNTFLILDPQFCTIELNRYVE